MKFFKIFLVLSVALVLFSCKKSKNNSQTTETSDNPFFSEYQTPFNVPPFDKIKHEHFKPAYEEAIKRQQEEIDEIVNNTDDPTFENTIVAYDNTGIMLSEVSNCFDNLNSSNTSDSMQIIAKEIAPLVSKHNDNIYLNEKLFARIKVIFDKKDELNLNAEQQMLLKTVYEDFISNGANVTAENKERFRAINEELSVLSLEFEENILAETNNYKLIIDKKEDLAGLTEQIIASAAEKAKADSLDGKWVFTTQKTSMLPFLQYSENRELRKQLLTAYSNRGNNNNENDNKEIVKKIISLKLEKSKLLGFNNFAEYRLSSNMSKTPDKVFDLLNQLWDAALINAKAEAIELQKLIDKEGGNFKIEPCDWWYYTEKLKKEKYDLDDEVLKPYFKLENVIEGAFLVANKLYGITFEKVEVPVYHPDVTVYQAKESDGTYIGLIYTDFYARDTKGGGAWMDNFRKQSRRKGVDNPPIITMNCNFSKTVGETPTLLTFDEVETLFHEFGHVLHGLLSDCEYYKISGTSVPRDFVELPSQIMENWALEPEVLKLYAKHYQTGEVLPQEILDKIIASGKFNQGFTTVEYLSAALLDMYWHTAVDVENIDVNEFEKATLDRIGLIPEIIVRYRSTYFSHIFSSSYSAGYYSYIWAEVIEADAYGAFTENGIFDAVTAKSFRDNILSKGGSVDPTEMFINFRGREPKIDALLERRGLTAK